jgi:uncharacterized protein YkwD
MRNLKKWLAAGCVFFFLCAAAMPQSLVELAAKEKARRAKLKDQKSILLTNEDLKKVSKTSALSAAKEPEAEKRSLDTKAPEPPAAVQSSPIKVTVSKRQSSQAGTEATVLTDQEELKNTEEIVGILTLKMRALWQEFYSMDDMTPRDVIQQQISETFQQLQEARDKANQLRKKLNLPPLDDEEGAIFIKLDHP